MKTSGENVSSCIEHAQEDIDTLTWAQNMQKARCALFEQWEACVRAGMLSPVNGVLKERIRQRYARTWEMRDGLNFFVRPLSPEAERALAALQALIATVESFRDMLIQKYSGTCIYKMRGKIPANHCAADDIMSDLWMTLLQSTELYDPGYGSTYMNYVCSRHEYALSDKNLRQAKKKYTVPLETTVPWSRQKVVCIGAAKADRARIDDARRKGFFRSIRRSLHLIGGGSPFRLLSSLAGRQAAKTMAAWTFRNKQPRPS